jgi:hypothetical protein
MRHLERTEYLDCCRYLKLGVDAEGMMNGCVSLMTRLTLSYQPCGAYSLP